MIGKKQRRIAASIAASFVRYLLAD